MLAALPRLAWRPPRPPRLVRVLSECDTTCAHAYIRVSFVHLPITSHTVEGLHCGGAK